MCASAFLLLPKTTDKLDWLLTGDKDVDLESLQDDRRNWHQYLQGQKMVYEAIRQHGLKLAKQG